MALSKELRFSLFEVQKLYDTPSITSNSRLIAKERTIFLSFFTKTTPDQIRSCVLQRNLNLSRSSYYTYMRSHIELISVFSHKYPLIYICLSHMNKASIMRTNSLRHFSFHVVPRYMYYHGRKLAQKCELQPMVNIYVILFINTRLHKTPKTNQEKLYFVYLELFPTYEAKHLNTLLLNEYT